MNAAIEFDLDIILESIDTLHSEVKKAFYLATMDTAKDVVHQIVTETAHLPGTGRIPGPISTRYQRTGLYESGWDAAAGFLGLSPANYQSTVGHRPPEEFVGSADGYSLEGENGDLDYVSFTANNRVRYALAIEESGTWIKPPPDQERRAPYLTVHKALAEHEEKFKEHILDRWNEI